MAATVDIHRLTSTAGATTSTAITNTTNRAATADDPAPGTSNPIPIPTSGTNYSYWVTTRLYISTAPSGTIDNIKWYTDGSNSMGTGVTASGQVSDPSKYVRATGTQGSTGTQLTSTNHTGLTTSAASIFGFTSGAPLTVSGSITAATGYVGQLVVYQIAVDNTAGPGATTAETVTWQYDET